MGIDTDLRLFYGYKLPLKKVTEFDLLNEEILDYDEYQDIDYEPSRDKIIEKYVDPLLKSVLKDKEWNIHIFDEEGYFFLYNREEVLYEGRNLTGTGEIDTSQPEPIEVTKYLRTKVSLPDGYEWKYSLHWVGTTTW